MEEKELKERVDEYVTKLAMYLESNKDVFDRTSGLTYNILKEDLEEAVQYQRGYYKNEKGEYRYVKGIEVTNDTGNLCRMGMNGEDRGVWVHFCELDERKVGYYDTPISMFISKHDPRFTDPENLMKPTTREDFEAQVQRTIRNICSDYTEAIDVQHYLDVLNGSEAIDEEYKDVSLLSITLLRLIEERERLKKL